MIDHRASVASYRTVVRIAARDSMIAIVETYLALRSMPEILRLHRMRVCPKPDPRTPCGIFGCTIFCSIRRTLLSLKLLIVPRHSSLDLVKVNVFSRRKKNFADQTLVFVEGSRI